MCHYSFGEFAKKQNKKIEELKICVFDDTLNHGRNFLNILGSLSRRGVKGENITFASPSINRLILDEKVEPKDHSSYLDKITLNMYERQEYKKENTIVKAKLFNPIKSNETDKGAYIFNSYLDINKSRGFVGYDEIVSRAYQLNQIAHFENVPYTSYCAYVKSRYSQVIDN
jgi:hypothetical protein